jgi:hypothetical protein
MRSFWPPSFYQPPTSAQRVFDIFFGILAPPLCVILDPGLFSGFRLGTHAIFSPLRILLYLEIIIGLSALAYYLFARRASYMLAGILYACALFSFLVGVTIFPFTLLALLAIIGVFGLVPFVTAFVFVRAGYRCLREAAQNVPAPHPFLRALPALLLTLAIPVALQFSVNHLAAQAMLTIEAGSSPDTSRAVQTLRRMRELVDFDDLAHAYQRSSDPIQRQRLADAFQSITGSTLQERLQRIHD